jgi:hypothetical protein
VLLALDRSPRTRLRVAVAPLAGAVLLFALSAGTLRPIELLVILGLLAWVAVPWPAALLRLAPLALVALIACTTLVLGRAPVMGLRSGDVYGRHADVFDFVRSRLTPQDRVLIVGGQPSLDLMAKSSTLFGLPNIHDYDPQATRRYAEFYTYLRTARRMRDFEDWYWIFDKLLPPTLQRPLFDLTGARYLIVAQPLDATQRAFASQPCSSCSNATACASRERSGHAARPLCAARQRPRRRRGVAGAGRSLARSAQRGDRRCRRSGASQRHRRRRVG